MKMENTKTQNWKDLIKNRQDEYIKELSGITATLNGLVNELTYSPYNLRANAEQIDGNEKLVWKVVIGKHSRLFYIEDFKPSLELKNTDSTLESRIKEALLEKFTFELK